MRVHVSLHCALIAAVLATSADAAGLPVSRAALAREGRLVREGAKMVVTPLVRDGKPHERVEFSAGERTLVVGKKGQLIDT